MPLSKRHQIEIPVMVICQDGGMIQTRILTGPLFTVNRVPKMHVMLSIIFHLTVPFKFKRRRRFLNYYYRERINIISKRGTCRLKAAQNIIL